MADGEKGTKVKVKFPESLQGGVYSNNMYVTHTKDEFILDFFMISPIGGVATARLILSPGHMKRVLNALNANIKKYEGKYGVIKEAEDPSRIIN